MMTVYLRCTACTANQKLVTQNFGYGKNICNECKTEGSVKFEIRYVAGASPAWYDAVKEAVIIAPGT